MNARTASNRAFTLIELLTALVIVAILAATAVPNFLESQLRSKTARVRSDMAVIEAALRAYYADYNEYPINNPELGEFKRTALDMSTIEVLAMATPTTATMSWGQNDPDSNKRPGNRPLLDRQSYGSAYTLAVLELSGFDLHVLTTPVPYLTRALPQDPYKNVREIPLTYISLADLPPDRPPATGVGPKRRYILGSAGPDTFWGGRLGDLSHHPVKGPFIPYDPTNGTVSAGDIVAYGHGQQEVEPLPPLQPLVPQAAGSEFLTQPVMGLLGP